MSNVFPIIYFSDNLIFNDSGKCFALYRLENFDYDFKSTDEKFEKLDILTRFLINLGEKSKLFIIPRVIDYRKQLLDIKELGGLDVLPDYVENTLLNLDNRYKGTVNEYAVYVATCLDVRGDIVRNVKEFLSQFFVDPIKSINEFINIQHREIPKSKLKYYKKASDDFLMRASRRIGLSEATAYDVQFLIKRMFFRGIEDESGMLRYSDQEGKKPWQPLEIENDKSKSIVPRKEELLTLGSGIFNIKNKTITIKHDKKTSYQSFVVISQLPEYGVFPGSEFFTLIQNLGFPIEVCITVENIDYRAVITKLERKKKEIKAQVEHIGESDEEIPEELYLAREAADSLNNDLKTDRSPVCRVCISFCVFADSQDDLEKRVEILRDMYKDVKIHMERPISDQERLFMDCIPGSMRYEKAYDLYLPPRTLGAGMFGTTQELGDKKGLYIGTTGILEKPVFLDIFNACQLNNSASAFVWGGLGGGKSFNVNLLAYLHALTGTYELIIDPKGERKYWKEKIPELAPYISITTIGNDKDDMGKLDPFLIYNDVDEDLVINIIAELFNIKVADNKFTILCEAVRKVKIEENPCMDTLVSILENFDKEDDFYREAVQLARSIKIHKKPGLSGLLYSDGTKEGLRFDKRVNIVEVQGLQLPLSDIPKDQYTTDETISTVLMLILAHYAKRFSHIDVSKRKLVVMDESWSLARTENGKNLFMTLARTGRSLNTSTIFIGHSVKDIPNEGIRNAINYKFCFNVNNTYEAVESLKFLNMEETKENIELLSSTNGLSNGECIFEDTYGRKGTLKFDAMFKRLIKAFDTTPPERRRENVV